MTSPSPTPDTRNKGHLSALVICHYVYAGLGLGTLAFMAGHYWFMNHIFTGEEFQKNAKDAKALENMMDIMIWFYIFGAVLVVAISIANLLSARFMKKRKHRLFSMIISGINCASIPLGLILGIFTFIVLCRDTVKADYQQNP